jgi:hypothetical protein
VSSIEDGIALMRAGATVVAMRRFLVEQLEGLGWQPAQEQQLLAARDS